VRPRGERELALSKAGAQLSRDHFERLRSSGELRQYLEDELDGKHLPPAPDRRTAELAEQVGAARYAWENQATAAVRTHYGDPAFEPALRTTLERRRKAIARGRVAAAEAAEEELSDLLDGLEFPDLLRAAARIERLERGLDW
jgi:hypothetical protein